MQLIWFRQDLRIQDHAALWYATQADTCLAVVILSPEQWAIHHDAPVKIDFYLRQLHSLKEQLHQLNIPLIIQQVPLWKDIPQALLDLSTTYAVETIHANIEFGVNELKRDSEVQNLLQQHKKTLELYQDRTLFPIGSIRNKSQHPYQVFGAFKKFCYEQFSLSLPQCYPTPTAQAPVNLIVESKIPTLAELGTQPLESHFAMQWPVGEDSALQRLDHFIDHQVSHYQNERDFPNLQGTSQLSPYLNIGLLSIRQCIQALFRKQQGAFLPENLGQQTWLDELLWREFYQHILYDFPQVSKHQPFKASTQYILNGAMHLKI